MLVPVVVPVVVVVVVMGTKPRKKFHPNVQVQEVKEEEERPARITPRLTRAMMRRKATTTTGNGGLETTPSLNALTNTSTKARFIAAGCRVGPECPG
jgi:hypothetical protein